MVQRTHPPPDPKTEALRQGRTLHPRPEAVQDLAFASDEFFDRRDLVQVKYEMLRRHRVDGRPVTEVARSFGVSRQAFYEAQQALEAEGISGLMPRPRGPQRAHKCTEEVLDFVEAWRSKHGGPDGESEADAVEQKFGVRIHPRSIDRALARRRKKRASGRRGPPTSA